EAGYEVIGVTMRLWTEVRADLLSYHATCCSVEAVDDARRVCQILDIPFYLVNLEREFQSYVVDYFCREYLEGRTPNPCLACNQFIKFSVLLQKAMALGADYLATGHYARIELGDGSYRLLKAVDGAKDQSYVLFTLGQEEMARLLFPIGHYLKSQVRQMAAERGLPVATKRDSQEICFIPDNDYRRFIGERASSVPGPIIDRRGNVLGRHQGLAYYTIGQRHGLGLSSAETLYVLAIDMVTNALVVGTQTELWSETLVVDPVYYVSGQSPSESVVVSTKVRYKSLEAAAWLIPQDSRALVRFATPQRAITPGQAAVFYQGEDVFGGGIIAATESSRVMEGCGTLSEVSLGLR
ncbi:MAG: tRNA 2-thiouridine(34) synthase MnmA, partial [Chloroflexi bacterium]|nr:tRNA 2-thiouridine(34) synthase MnmA [Chloroflexota bacterium]